MLMRRLALPAMAACCEVRRAASTAKPATLHSVPRRPDAEPQRGFVAGKLPIAEAPFTPIANADGTRPSLVPTAGRPVEESETVLECRRCRRRLFMDADMDAERTAASGYAAYACPADPDALRVRSQRSGKTTDDPPPVRTEHPGGEGDGECPTSAAGTADRLSPALRARIAARRSGGVPPRPPQRPSHEAGGLRFDEETIASPLAQPTLARSLLQKESNFLERNAMDTSCTLKPKRVLRMFDEKRDYAAARMQLQRTTAVQKRLQVSEGEIQFAFCGSCDTFVAKVFPSPTARPGEGAGVWLYSVNASSVLRRPF